MFCFVCLFKQKTAYEMRISDWSSDVCSSDLLKANVGRIADHCRVAGVGWGVEEVPYGHLCDAADCSNPAYSASGAPLVQFDTEDSGRRRAACLKTCYCVHEKLSVAS